MERLVRVEVVGIKVGTRVRVRQLSYYTVRVRTGVGLRIRVDVLGSTQVTAR